MLPVSLFLSKKRHIFGFFRKNAFFPLKKALFFVFFLIISENRLFLAVFSVPAVRVSALNPGNFFALLRSPRPEENEKNI